MSEAHYPLVALKINLLITILVSLFIKIILYITL